MGALQPPNHLVVMYQQKQRDETMKTLAYSLLGNAALIGAAVISHVGLDLFPVVLLGAMAVYCFASAIFNLDWNV